jgi:hypothetical protein
MDFGIFGSDRPKTIPWILQKDSLPVRSMEIVEKRSGPRKITMIFHPLKI